ncbi:hypothetical protein [Adhaeretor mobilis]|uniref:Uncharacterized protein n=1 Tax=Adhaeretor mobilis TaxID=1930276 RepID=A0A517MS23_9BACT|nr:hypothetical protein [Adhaeretor mobilis]QDS97675.1 hypothetical protein HG15A2_09390 [Adhaeretor mobilis]
MPLELGIWRIDNDLQQMQFAPLDFEARLQDILAHDVSIADPNLMIIGREVKTTFEKRIPSPKGSKKRATSATKTQSPAP